MWKQIYLDGDYTNYEVNEYGDVRNIITGRLLTPRMKTGYLSTTISNKNGNRRMIRTHRLVCEAFKPLRKKGQDYVNHIDGDKLHNHISNLEWLSPKENLEHAKKTGLIKLGEDRGNSKYSNEMIRRICQDLEDDKLSFTEIGKKYGIPRSIACNIVYSGLWKSISKDFDFRKKDYSKKTLARYYDYIDKLLLADISTKKIVDEYRIDGFSKKKMQNFVFNSIRRLKKQGLL